MDSGFALTMTASIFGFWDFVIARAQPEAISLFNDIAADCLGLRPRNDMPGNFLRVCQEYRVLYGL